VIVNFCFVINLVVFHSFNISDTTGDEIMIEPNEEVIGNPHCDTPISSRSTSPIGLNDEEEQSNSVTSSRPIVDW